MPDSEDTGLTILQTAKNYSPNNTASPPLMLHIACCMVLITDSMAKQNTNNYHDWKPLF